MTDKQLKAVPLYKRLEKIPADIRFGVKDGDDWRAGTTWYPIGAMCQQAAAELRRLHEENKQWQDKCNTYIELHDAVVKDSDRLDALNAELVEALKEVQRDVHRIIKGHFVHLPTVDEELSEALAKAEGK